MCPLFRSLEARQPVEHLKGPRSFPREPRLGFDDPERLRRVCPHCEELPRWLDPYGLDAPLDPAELFESPWGPLFELFEASERLDPS